MLSRNIERRQRSADIAAQKAGTEREQEGCNNNSCANDAKRLLHSTPNA
jgi:hypothetical protein